MGFDSLRITGTRLTGANPGKTVDMRIDLTKRAAGFAAFRLAWLSLPPRPSGARRTKNLIVDKSGVRHIMDHMKTATVRELRNEFPRIEAWVHEGESINISKRGKVIAMLVPPSTTSTTGGRVPKPDIMARLHETWGDRIFSLEEVAAMREDELAGSLG